MTVVSCMVFEHRLALLLLAALVCGSGTFVTMSLYGRSRSFDGRARLGWLFLTAICAGTTTWTTHFVAMIGYRPDVPANYDFVATIASVFVAIFGGGLGFWFATRSQTRRNTFAAGMLVGLSIAGMHYLGMFGYHIVGLIEWNWSILVLSFVLVAAFSIGSLWMLRHSISFPNRVAAAATMTSAIVLLHLTGMSAVTVVPLDSDHGTQSIETASMALTISMVAMLVIGTGLSTCIIDMDRRIRSDKSLQDLAFRDPLTGLPNRRALHAKMDSAFSEQRWFKLLLLDLDHFKVTNDTYGHGVGDKLLREIANRIVAVAGGDACAYRIGGDEMAVLIFKDRETALQIAHELVAAIREPMEIDGHRIVSGCSVGICAFEHADDAETLMRRADTALYEAKRRGRGQVFRYTPGMLEIAMQRAQLESDLQLAVGRRQFQLHYQPIVDLTSSQTLGYEALLRWTHPEHGSVSPTEFIPIAESCGAIVGIGRWVLEEACREAASWSKAWYVAVNVSAVQLRLTSFPTMLASVLMESGMSPQRLTIELTETSILNDTDEIATTLSAVRALGVRVSMDDFGTGYSSLSHLRRLPVDVIKIDRSFVVSAQVDQNSMVVLKGIIWMGREMGIATVAEGVETSEQRDMLLAAECNSAQGYLFGKPQPSGRLNMPLAIVG